MNEEVDLSGISDADIRAYLLDMGIDPDKALSDSDKAAISQSKTTAQQTGNSKLINTVNTILGFINTEIGVLSKNGIIGKQQLSSTYPTLSNLAGSSSTDTTTNTDNAPKTGLFNIDFTSPTTLIIVFVAIVLLFYFLFFKPKSKNGKR